MRIPPRGFHYMALMKETTSWDKCLGHCLVINPFLTQMKTFQSRLKFHRMKKRFVFCKSIGILSGKSVGSEVIFIKQILPDRILFQYVVSYSIPKSFHITPKVI